MGCRVRVGSWAGLLFAAAALAGCLGDAFAHCDLEGRKLGPEEEVDGVDATAIVDSLMGTHTGSLTWQRTGEETELTFTTSRHDGVAYRDARDCDDGEITFRASVAMTLVSGDALIQAEGQAVLVLDREGAVDQLQLGGKEPDSWLVSVDYTELYEAGVTDPRTSYHPGSRFRLMLDPDTLAPTAAILDLVDRDCSEGTCSENVRETLATGRF